MAYVDNTPTGNEPPFSDAKKQTVVRIPIDFSVSGNSLAQNDLMGIALIPAGMDVISAKLKVTTANTSVTDVDLGLTADDGSPSTAADLIDGATLASTGYKSGVGTRVQCTEDKVLVLTNKSVTTLAAGAVDVIVELADMR